MHVDWNVVAVSSSYFQTILTSNLQVCEAHVLKVGLLIFCLVC